MFEYYWHVHITADEPPPAAAPPQPSDDELEFERDGRGSQLQLSGFGGG